MSHFSTTLSVIIESHRWTQAAFAKRCKIAQSALSQYLSDARKVTADQLALILRPLEHEDRVALMLAVLKDTIPGDEFADLVMLEPCGTESRLREEAVASWRKSALPPKVQTALEVIASEAVTDAEVRSMLVSFADFIRSTKK